MRALSGSFRPAKVIYVELTRSYEQVIPRRILERYAIRETRNAATILRATSPIEFDEMVDVLATFSLTTNDLLIPGGNKSTVARRLDDAFRKRGWREGRVDTRIISEFQLQPHRPAGELKPTVRTSEVFNKGYKADNVKGRIALDIEWNAKDGNLDRDIGAYRALYDAGVIDGAVMITRTQELAQLANKLGREAGLSVSEAARRLGSTTTTNLDKLEPRMTRGDGGGCPLLAVAISERCWSK